MQSVIRNTLIAFGLAGTCMVSSAVGALVPLSYGAGYDSDTASFDFFIRFDRAPNFFDVNGNRVDNLLYWLNSMYGINAFHASMELHLPKEMQLGTTSILLVTADNTMSLVRLDGTSPPIFGQKGTLIRELPFSLAPDHTLRFSLTQPDLDDVDGGIAAVFETYRPNETPSGMFIQQIPEPASIYTFCIGLLLVAAQRLRRLVGKPS
jgi:hypothetical protein